MFTAASAITTQSGTLLTLTSAPVFLLLQLLSSLLLPLTTTAQNGNLKLAQLLVKKGANPDHQNKQGQTAGHYATAYQFFDFTEWLFSAEGGAANDQVENKHGLGPYDGLTVEGSNDPQENSPLMLEG
jgi:ankyrin repeat protein